MKNSKIYQVISQLSIPDLNRLDKYLRSPYHNANDKVNVLFDYLFLKRKNKEQFDESEITHEFVERYELSNVQWRKLKSDLNSQIENFIAQEEFQKDTLFQYKLLLDGLAKKELKLGYKKTITNSKTLLDRQLERSSEYFLRKYQLEKNFYELTSQFEKKSSGNPLKIEELISEISHELDIYYLIEKMRMGLDLLSWKRMYKINVDLKEYEFTARLIEKSDYQNIPALNIYYTIYKATVNEAEELYFYRLKDLVNKHLDKFPKDQQREIFDSMISYCINKLNKGSQKFTAEALEVYKYGLTNELMLQQGFLSPTTFRNIVVIALRCKEFEYAIDFIEDYSKSLQEEYRQNAVNFNLARIHFYQKDYKSTIQKLNLVDFEDVWYNVNSRIMQLASYYELDEYNALESVINSYTTFLRREKSLTQRRKEEFLNFVKLLNKLYKIPVFNRDKLSQLKTEISDTDILTSKVWLLEKIDEKITETNP